jgi:2-polyprenyl-6-methoxyphenol hydroxylase-like FAD-dependent oxidoreductase
MKTDVVIVGAGPTGLTLAVALRQRGIDAVVLDRQAEATNTSRAAVVHARTLEVLEEFDVSRRMVDQGLIAQHFAIRDGERPLLQLDFSSLPSKYPYALMLPQSATEAILLTRLRELGGEVRRPVTVTKLLPDGVELDSGETITARYVVGADGMHSVVREQAGIGFTGSAYEESFVLADVLMDWPLSPTEVQLFLDPLGVTVVAPLPGGQPGRHYRIVATVAQAPEQPSLADVQALLDARGPRGAAVREVVWGSRFRVHHRLADRYHAGNAILAGDAAHVHSPAGGQGMNTGIQDAVALAAAIESGDIEGYERTRRPVAEGVVRFTDLTTRAATLKGAPGRAARNTLFRVLSRIPQVRNRIAYRVAELNNR